MSEQMGEQTRDSRIKQCRAEIARSNWMVCNNRWSPSQGANHRNYYTELLAALEKQR